MAIRCSHLLRVTLIVNVINHQRITKYTECVERWCRFELPPPIWNDRRTNIIPPPLIGGDEPPLDYFTTETSTLTESTATAVVSTNVESTAVESVAGAEPLPPPHATNPTVNVTNAANNTFFIFLCLYLTNSLNFNKDGAGCI